MAFIFHLILSIPRSIFYGFRYILKLFSRLGGQCIAHKFLYSRNPEPKTISSPIEQQCYKEEDYLQSQKEIKEKLNSNAHKKAFNEKTQKSKGDSIENIVRCSIQTENFQKSYHFLERQVNFIGDSYDSLTPKPSLLTPDLEVMLKENIQKATSLSHEIKQMKRLKIKQASKYTVSLDILSSKADGLLELLQFLDELNKPPLIHSEQIRIMVSTKPGLQHDDCKVPCGSGKSIFKNYYPEINLTMKTYDEDSCNCLQTNHCLLCVDSEEDFDNFKEREILINKTLLCDELLTPEELASVETGSDDNWLYIPKQSNLISASA